jgi:hypothetical protein
LRGCEEAIYVVFLNIVDLEISALIPFKEKTTEQDGWRRRRVF